MKQRTFATRLLAPFSLCLALFATSVEAASVTAFVPEPNEFEAAIVMVPRTHEVLYAYEASKPHPAASLTKLANALAFVKGTPAWNTIISLRREDEVGGGRLRVAIGARMTIKDLMYSSITASANNAATAMMRLSGKKKSVFLKEMNQAVAKTGAKYSTFVDGSGMDPRNMTTANDMALIADTAFRNPTIRRAATTMKYTFVVRNTGEKKTITNTNLLLTHDPDVWVVGGKTGYLEESKYNLVVQMRPLLADGSNIPSKEVIVVVFGAPTKDGQFTSAKRLAQWAWQQYEFPRPRQAP
jgi:D-alanyl-D-alanine endopeptidase (penicillin-binding protein 7)